MERISETVKKILEDLSSKKDPLDYKRIILSLKKVLSRKEIKHIHLNSLRKGELRINTDSTVFLYQLNLKKNLILKKIKEDFGPDLIKGVRFHLGEIDATST